MLWQIVYLRHHFAVAWAPDIVAVTLTELTSFATNPIVPTPLHHLRFADVIRKC